MIFDSGLIKPPVKIDDWFGDVDPEKPASATIRVMLDNYWNKHDEYEVKPRVFEGKSAYRP